MKDLQPVCKRLLSSFVHALYYVPLVFRTSSLGTICAFAAVVPACFGLFWPVSAFSGLFRIVLRCRSALRTHILLISVRVSPPSRDLHLSYCRFLLCSATLICVMLLAFCTIFCKVHAFLNPIIGKIWNL